ncbi:MAG: glycine--tRNA ligase, partial [Planctomycetota bacterium]
MTAPEDKNMDELVALCKRRGFVYPASEIYGGLRGFWDYGPLGTALKNNIRDWWWRCMVDCPPIGPDGQPVSIVGLDSAIIQNPKTWEHSGHVGGFNDPLVDCTETKKRYRADHLHVVSFVEVTEKKEDGSQVSRSTHMYAYSEADTKSYDVALKKAVKEKKKLGLAEVTEPLTTPYMGLDAGEFDDVVGPDATKAGTLTEPRQFNLMLDTYPGPIRDEENKAYLRPETA